MSTTTHDSETIKQAWSAFAGALHHVKLKSPLDLSRSAYADLVRCADEPLPEPDSDTWIFVEATLRDARLAAETDGLAWPPPSYEALVPPA